MDAWQIPPAIYYGFATLLIVMGAMRAYHLGWKARPEPAEREDESVDSDEGSLADDTSDGSDVRGEVRSGAGRFDRAATAYKRHIAMGVLWILLGVFLVASMLFSKRRSEAPRVRFVEATTATTPSA